jgi:DHA1 family inner membrane transport protein
LLSLGGLLMWWLTHRESRRVVTLNTANCAD